MVVVGVVGSCVGVVSRGSCRGSYANVGEVISSVCMLLLVPCTQDLSLALRVLVAVR